MNNNELQHTGVLGMKWGHRKARPVGQIHSVNPKQRADGTYKAKMATDYGDVNVRVSTTSKKPHGTNAVKLGSQYVNQIKVLNPTAAGFISALKSIAVGSTAANVIAGVGANKAAKKAFNGNIEGAGKTVLKSTAAGYAAATAGLINGIRAGIKKSRASQQAIRYAKKHKIKAVHGSLIKTRE